MSGLALFSLSLRLLDVSRVEFSSELASLPAFCCVHCHGVDALSLHGSRHERMHTGRPHHVEDAGKCCLEDDLVNLEVLDEVLNVW